jgi:hypothetical protein
MWLLLGCCRRPGSQRKMREMSGNHIFEGPYPIKENCDGAGSDITGCCPPVRSPFYVLGVFDGKHTVL